jgi:hypothetical protein
MFFNSLGLFISLKYKQKIINAHTFFLVIFIKMLHVPYKIYLKNQIIIDLLIINKFISENKIKILIYI